jgi:hypothetical protein
MSDPNHTDNLGEIGVHAVGLLVRKELGWIFRQQAIPAWGRRRLLRRDPTDAQATFARRALTSDDARCRSFSIWWFASVRSSSPRRAMASHSRRSLMGPRLLRM